MKRTSLLAFIFVLGVFCVAANSIAADKPSQRAKAILVLDASGSMWGQLQGKTKIELARDVVGDLVKNVSPDLDLGLVAYGHRKKGDCDDIESLLDPAPVDRGAFSRKVNAIQPKGMTPLSAAVVKAAEKLRFTEDKATVILVSDGIETCDLDPCAVGKALEEQGIDFTAHVIGFGVTKDEEKQLRCLAETTGGEYRTANDAGALSDALGKAIEKAAVKPEFNLIVQARHQGSNDPLNGAVDWRLVSGTKEISKLSGGVGRFNVSPGEYTVSGSWGGLNAETKVTVPEQEVAEETLFFNGSFLTVRGLRESNGEEIAESIGWNVFQALPSGKPGKRVIVAGSAKREFILPAGAYLVRGQYGNLEQEAQISLDDGDRKEVALVFDVGRVSVYGLIEEGGEKIGQNIGWRVYERKADGSRGKSKLSAGGSERMLSLPSGEYLVSGLYHSVELEQPVTVASGQTTDLPFVFVYGDLKVSGVRFEGGPPITDNIGWRITKRDPATGEFTKSVLGAGGSNREFSLPPGEYRVEGDYGQARPAQQVTVEQNKTVAVTLAFDVGKIELSGLRTEGGAEISENISWRILTPGDGFEGPKNFVAGGGHRREFKVPAGRYIVRGEYGYATAEREVTVEAGKAESIQMVFNVGKLKVKAFTGDEGAKSEVNASWKLFNSLDGEAAKQIASVNGKERDLTLPAGEYVLAASHGGKEVRQPVTVVAGKAEELEVIIR